EFAAESDAVVLWHLDEAGNGAARILDSALLSIDGTASASSLAQTGRFGGARSSASIVADDDFLSLGFGSSSFTVECWFKTDPVGVNGNLVAKINSNGVSNPDFALKLLPSGVLRAQLFNGPGVEWRLDVLHTTYVVDDNQWHLVAMVVDRTTDQLKLYVDGLERGSANAPAGFGAMRNLGERLRAGINDGNSVFTGLLDEIRVSSSAHSAAAVAADFIGADGPRVARVLPSIIQRGT